MITYMRVVWDHDFDDEPVLLLSEVEDGREVRKIEKFRDGTANHAGPRGSSGDIMLSQTPMPRPEEIARDPQFSAAPMRAEDFEAEWRAAGGR